jgi:hypothetical protein
MLSFLECIFSIPGSCSVFFHTFPGVSWSGLKIKAEQNSRKWNFRIEG